MNAKPYQVVISNPHTPSEMKVHEFETRKEAIDYATLHKDEGEDVRVVKGESGEAVLIFQSGIKTYEEDT